ncbi:hypothetical protein SLEP1_g22825 [Rubroshorea leprosula]|uniref:Retrotransposon gag domain-containing protein n=1 Tax=Rubroshorea leprosula TaxID=152421 RepID=A0AAV5JGG5_9ROSI|nr:hypothetical protein SLEP1_g22825 [Rubroshorea leprosula]
MASTFATKFSNRRLIRKITSKLMQVKQRDRESLKNYMSRFNDAILKVSSFNQAVGIAAVIQGLQHKRFRDSLIKHPATTFNEVNGRSLKFKTIEEYALSQKPVLPKNQNPDWRDEVVTMASSFNAVIGRPTLTTIRTVVSQFHLCMEFPTSIGIATLRDMPGIPTSVSQHKLSTNPLKKPVVQKRRLFGGKRFQVIKEEVEKLLQAGFVRRVDYYEWVANPVLVKKANDKWRMCIDYTNLN